jgi:hypothetical protein
MFSPFIKVPDSAEEVLKRLTVALHTHLPAVLEWAGNDLPLPMAEEIGASLYVRSEFPSIEIQWLRSTPIEDSGDDECPVTQSQHEIQIDLAVVSTEPDVLLWEYLRYSKAVRATVLNTTVDNFLLTSLGGGVAPLRSITEEKLLETGTLQNSTSIHLRRGLITLIAIE